MRKLIATIAGIAMCGAVMSAQAPAGDAAKGKAVYAEKKCGVCHKTSKDDAAGGKLSTVLADMVGKMSAADLKSWFTETAKMEAKLAKKPVMPMSGSMKTAKLTDADVANLVAYMQTLK